jgi:hypothetical protein
MSRVLRRLGDIALEQGDHELARDRYVESLTSAREAGASGRFPEALEALASLAAVRGWPRRAMRLAGAAAALRAGIGQHLPLAEQAALTRSLAQARQALTTEQQAAEWAHGEAMTLEQAVAEAAGDPTDSAAESGVARTATRAAGMRLK